MSKRAPVAVALAAALAGTVAALSAQTANQVNLANQLNLELEKGASLNALRQWLDAAQQHRWGEADAAAQATASWTSEDLELLLPSLVYYLDCGRRTQLSPSPKSNALCWSCDESSRERRRLLQYTKSRAPAIEVLTDVPLPNRLNDSIIRGAGFSRPGPPEGGPNGINAGRLD